MKASAGALRIALLHHGYGSSPGGPGVRVVRDLALALAAAGNQPHVLSSHRGRTHRTTDEQIPVLLSRRLPERALQLRGFEGPLTHVPLTVRALLLGRFDAAHAFSPPDALAALLWRDLVRRPVVFTCIEPLARDRLADRRLRLWLLRRAVEESDAVTVATEAARISAVEWLAAPPLMIDCHDAARHERLYRGLLLRAR